MSTTQETAQIPVIDISGGQPDAEIGRALVDAAATYGFVYVKNEGKDIPVAAISRMFDLSKRFFASPAAEKEKCKINQTNHGWVGMHTETLGNGQNLGDFKEAFNIAQFQHGKPQQALPSVLAENEDEVASFQKYCNDMVLKLLTLFSIGLEIPPSSGGSSFLPSRHTDGPTKSILRLLYYPPIPPSFPSSNHLRAGAHSDYGSLTLLFRLPGQPGLEILPPSSSIAFTPVPIHPPGTEGDVAPPVLVNIGDLLSAWTNGLLRSTVHRVVFPGEGGGDRYSIAYFAHPVGTTVLETVPSERVRRAGLKSGTSSGEGVKGMTADEYLLGRLRATYKGLYDNGENGKGKSEST